MPGLFGTSGAAALLCILAGVLIVAGTQMERGARTVE
jgi:hypothetical protein